MFTLNYFYFFIIAFFFSSAVTRYARSNMEGINPWPKLISQLIGPLCDLVLLIFLVIGFWKMPHWWHPIIFIIIGTILQGFQGLFGQKLNFVTILLGLIIAPIFTILAYLGMFGVI